jgi:hypothetical protein
MIRYIATSTDSLQQPRGKHSDAKIKVLNSRAEASSGRAAQPTHFVGAPVPATLRRRTTSRALQPHRGGLSIARTLENRAVAEWPIGHSRARVPRMVSSSGADGTADPLRGYPGACYVAACAGNSNMPVEREPQEVARQAVARIKSGRFVRK